MKKSRVAKTLQDSRARIGKSQEQLSIDTFQSRESVSKQENGKRRVQPGLTKRFIDNYNDPWIALEAANEYIGWGVTQLDGPAADNNPSSVKSVLEEVLNEALESVLKVNFNTELAQSMQQKDIRTSANKLVDVVHWSVVYLAIICETQNINWRQIWEDHHSELQSQGYLT
ncbi:XRE family transcriptional regulator [Halobacillus sp. MO56]